MKTKKIAKSLDSDQIDGYWLDCDFVGGACDAYENGNRHLEVSELLAKQENYGFAISHLVLGVEELIKALILIFLNADRHFISHDNKEKLFANHGFKHINIKKFLLALTHESIEDYHANWFDYYFDGNPNNNFQQKAFKISKMFNLEHIDDGKIEEIVSLINNANDLKNRGFYVDYNDDWLIPKDIDRSTFKSYVDISQILSKFIRPLFTTSLTGNDELIEFIYGR